MKANCERLDVEDHYFMISFLWGALGRDIYAAHALEWSFADVWQVSEYALVYAHELEFY